MKIKRRRFRNKEILIEGARAMTEKDWTLLKVEARMSIPHSTLYRFIRKYLPCIDYELYTACIEALNRHKHNHRRGED